MPATTVAARLLALSLLFEAAAFSQGNFAQITGLITDASGAAVPQAKIEVVQPTGPDTLVLIHLNDTPVTCRVHPEAGARPGQPATLMFDLSKLVYFDPQTEKFTEFKSLIPTKNDKGSAQTYGAAGDITTYPGKVPLIAVGFGEAALAVNNAAPFIDSRQGVFPGHSSGGAE